MNADRTAARRALLDLLDAHDAAGRAVPCRVQPDAGWTSDRPDEQAYGARLCERCPALDQCRAYGLAFPKEAGVYGGLTDLERRRGAERAS